MTATGGEVRFGSDDHSGPSLAFKQRKENVIQSLRAIKDRLRENFRPSSGE